METCKRITLKFLLTLVLICGFSIIGFAQTLEESKELPYVVVPEQAMEQLVRRVLIWSFKPRNKPTVIYLSAQRIKQSWLPEIKNIEFRLLSFEEIQQKNLKVHFFAEPEFSENIYSVGFAFGSPTCESIGENWCFRISNQKIKLRLCGAVGGGCNP
jgi:hypothetical protein